MRDPSVSFPTLKPSQEGAYDVVEPKICEEPNCGKTFMRKIATGSRVCGQCQAKTKKIGELMQLASKKIQ